MRVLFVISVLALLALLWASVATAQHIRRARRRRRRFLESEQHSEAPRGTLGLSHAEATAPVLTFKDSSAQHEIAVAAPSVSTPVVAKAAAEPVLTPVEPSISEPEITEAVEEQIEAEAQPLAEEPPWAPPVELTSDPEPEPEIAEAAEEQLEAEGGSPALEPEPEPEQAKAEEPPSAPAPPRVFKPTHVRHPLASLIPPIERPDWAFFNKDMGDLSDPAPRTGQKIRPNLPHDPQKK